MSVFAHVVSRNLAPEPAATQALEYVLKNPKALRTFMGMLAPLGVSFEPGSVESERAFGDGQPDLTIYDSAGQHRLFVENKFWAGLTDAQPVTYLSHLPQNDDPSALVFLVPEARVQSVWAELRRRCTQADLSIAEEGCVEVPLAGKLSGNRVLAVTDWRRVLNGLAVVDSVRSDVQQLRALTERMDVDAFLPIRAAELTDADVARRMINYADLVQPIVDRLIDRRVASIKRLNPAHGWHTAGRYLRLHDRFGSWLGVDFDAWRDNGTTPLWWKVSDSEFGGVATVWDEIDGWFDDVQTQADGPWKCVPIRLVTGVERDVVIKAAADKVESIGRRLRDRLS